MKGLVYRDFCLAKKMWIPLFCVSVGAVIWNVLAQLSMQVGNLKTLFADEEVAITKIVIYYIGLYLIPYVGIMLIDTSPIIRADLPVKWAMNRRMFPVTPLKWAGSLYLLKLIAVIIVLMLFIINGLLMSTMSGNSFGIYDVNNMLMMISFYLIYDVIYTAILVTARTESGIDKAGLSAMVIMILACTLLTTKAKAYSTKLDAFLEEAGEDIAMDERMTAIKSILQEEFGVYRDQIAPFMWLIMLALLGLGFYLTYLGIRRREK